MATVYLGLGSNLGKRYENILTAIKLLHDQGVSVIKRSSVIETDPVGGPQQQGPYLNAVIEAKTSLLPHELLLHIHSIENILGRKRTVINGPRTIDIDILLYESESIQSPELTIPHPRMCSRNFVMEPLKEISPKIAEDIINARI